MDKSMGQIRRCVHYLMRLMLLLSGRRPRQLRIAHPQVIAAERLCIVAPVIVVLRQLLKLLACSNGTAWWGKGSSEIAIGNSQCLRHVLSKQVVHTFCVPCRQQPQLERRHFDAEHAQDGRLVSIQHLALSAYLE